MFDRGALREIFDALPFHLQDELRARFQQMGCRHKWGLIIDADLHLVEQAMIELGYIAPVEEVPATDAGAEEYEDIFAGQDAYHDLTRSV